MFRINPELSDIMKSMSLTNNELKNYINLNELILIAKKYEDDFDDETKLNEVTPKMIQCLNEADCNDLNENLIKLYSLALKLTDRYESVSDEIMVTDLPLKLIEDALKCKDVDVFKIIVSIIHNVARYPGNEIEFQDDNLKNKIKDILKESDNDLSCLLMLILITDEGEQDQLVNDFKTITLLFNYIPKSLKSNNHYYDGFSLWELLNGLRCIIKNEKVKKSININMFFKFLQDVINKYKNLKEIEMVIWLLVNLSFDKNMKEKINESFDLVTLKKTFKDKSDLLNILFKSLEFQEISVPINDKKSFKYDIFVSYARKDSEKVDPIIKKLTEMNFKIWIDKSDVNNKPMQAIVDGINDSKILLIFASKYYIDSRNCKNEGHFANRIEKPIVVASFLPKFPEDSWLGLITSINKYHKFINGFNEEYFNKMVADIKENLEQ